MTLVATPEQLAETERLRRMYPNAPEFADDTFTPRPFLTGQTAAPAPSMPSRNVLADVMRPRATQQAQPEKPKRSFGETIGRIGDILAIMGGREPVFEFYQQQRMAEQQANAAREGLMGFATGQQTPQDVARLIGLGIDPAKINALRTAGMTEPEMTALMREVAAATGFQPGTPEFRAELARQMNNRGLSGALIGGPDTGYRVNPLYQPPSSSAPAPQTPQAPAMGQPEPQAQGSPLSMSDLQRVATSFPNANAMMDWMRRNNITVRVSTPQEAANLPRGTRLILPDGSPGVVP